MRYDVGDPIEALVHQFHIVIHEIIGKVHHLHVVVRGVADLEAVLPAEPDLCVGIRMEHLDLVAGEIGRLQAQRIDCPLEVLYRSLGALFSHLFDQVLAIGDKFTEEESWKRLD